MPETDRVKMKIWNVAAKVADVDAEIKFVQELGGALVLDETLLVEGQAFRVALMKWADKYLHLFANAVYEPQLQRPLACGLCHVVMEVSDLDLQRSRALEAGAREVMSPQFISAGFGTRDVVFLQSPGGILFELIRVHEHLVPELP
jgi:predicted enzyme related to lactoylglutathione lyase